MLDLAELRRWRRRHGARMWRSTGHLGDDRHSKYDGRVLPRALPISIEAIGLSRFRPRSPLRTLLEALGSECRPPL